MTRDLIPRHVFAGAEGGVEPPDHGRHEPDPDVEQRDGLVLVRHGLQRGTGGRQTLPSGRQVPNT